MLMNSDIVFSREQIQRLIWACQDKIDTEDLVALLVSARDMSEQEGVVDLRIAYRDGRPEPQLQAEAIEKLYNVRATLTRLVTEYVRLADSVSTDLTAQGRSQECHELLEVAGQILQHTADSINGNLPSGEFATPPGTLGVWAVWTNEAREDDEPRLFLSRAVAQKYADDQAYCDPQPHLVWAVSPKPVNTWFVQRLLAADGSILQTGQSKQLQGQDPNDYVTSLVHPTVEVYPNQHGGWTAEGWGSDLQALTVAVDAAARAKSEEVSR